MTTAMKAVQYFSDEQLQRSQALSATEKMRFLDEYRQLHGRRQANIKSRLISLKVPEDLLELFKQRCEASGVKYQTQIKQLMREYLSPP
jgi:predicted DNA binding CopG/RHH family protein